MVLAALTTTLLATLARVLLLLAAATLALSAATLLTAALTWLLVLLVVATTLAATLSALAGLAALLAALVWIRHSEHSLLINITPSLVTTQQHLRSSVIEKIGDQFERAGDYDFTLSSLLRFELPPGEFNEVISLEFCCSANVVFSQLRVHGALRKW